MTLTTEVVRPNMELAKGHIQMWTSKTLPLHKQEKFIGLIIGISAIVTACLVGSLSNCSIQP